MKQLNWKLMMSFALVALVSFTGAGCKSKKPVDTGTDTGTKTETGSNDNSGVDQDSLLFGPSGLQPIYFDFDSSSLRADQVAVVNRNAELLKTHASAVIQVAGHTDERGTQEYNLALGERRALTVREALIRAGISGDRIVTISYGEESPAEAGSNEGAWAKNRRAEFNKASR